jgi:hypothetical protein
MRTCDQGRTLEARKTGWRRSSERLVSEAMGTAILLMTELQKASCCEENYSSAGLTSIARGFVRNALVVAAPKPLLREGATVGDATEGRAPSQPVDGTTLVDGGRGRLHW